MNKLHVGCGNDILPGWVNHDLVALPGVDVVHDLTAFPWPFEANRFEEIRMYHVLEHLPDTIRTVEELHRIAAPGARVAIRVPFWNSPDWATDPTHRASFSEHSFDYFDPSTRHGRERPYYSTARFRVARKHYWTRWGGVYRQVTAPWRQRWLERLARHLCGVIWVVEFELIALKDGVGAPAGGAA